jgi:predicted permease
MLYATASDVRLAARHIRLQAGSSAAIVVTLALGIGASTAAYAVFNYVLFRPVPGITGADRIVTVDFEGPGRNFGYSSRAVAEDLRRASSFEVLAPGYSTQVPVLGGNAAGAEMLNVESIGAGYFRAIGVRARAGRLLSDDEVRSGAGVAVISERLWRTNYEASPSVIGGRLLGDGQPFTIVGVMDAYQGWSTSRVGTTAAWIPLGTERAGERTRDIGIYHMLGRLRAGVPAAAAEEELRALYAHLVPAGDRSARWVPTVRPGLFAMGSESVARQVRAVYPLVMGATGLLLLLACANAANLLLARMARRERALALRSAIGAGRGHLLRGIVIEASALAGISAAAGLAIASGFTKLMGGMRPFRSGPVLLEVTIDWRVAAFAIFIAALAVFIFAVFPAITAARVDVQVLLQRQRSTASHGRARRALVAGQLALSLVLVASAVVLTRSVSYLRGLDLGLDADRVEEFTIRAYTGDGERHDAFVRTALARLSQTAGLQDVAVSSPSAFTKNRFLKQVRAAGDADHPFTSAFRAVVSGGYFSTLRIPLVSGRTFTETEYAPLGERRSGVALVSESLARQLFGRRSAVGRHLTVAERNGASGASARDVEIVGVAGDTRSGWAYEDAERPTIYEPDHATLVLDTFYVRSALPAAEVETRMRRAMRELDARIPLQDVMTLRQEIDDLFPEERAIAGMMRLVALVAAGLGLAGIGSVVAFTASERRRELGIRAALGASGTRLITDTVRASAISAAIGVAIGLAVYAMVSRILAAHLHGIHALDPLTLIGATVALVAASVLAAYVPAVRAARIDPAVVLRAE